MRVTDLNLQGDLPLLMMPPARSFEDRLLRLEPFHVRALRLHIDSLDTELMTYRPRSNAPGSDQAAASMHGVLGRLLKTVGIANDDLTASCVYTSGLRRILDTSGVEDALLAAALAPTSGHRLLKLLGRDTDTPPPLPPCSPCTRTGSRPPDTPPHKPHHLGSPRRRGLWRPAEPHRRYPEGSTDPVTRGRTSRDHPHDLAPPALTSLYRRSVTRSSPHRAHADDTGVVPRIPRMKPLITRASSSTGRAADF